MIRTLLLSILLASQVMVGCTYHNPFNPSNKINGLYNYYVTYSYQSGWSSGQAFVTMGRFKEPKTKEDLDTMAEDIKEWLPRNGLCVDKILVIGIIPISQYVPNKDSSEIVPCPDLDTLKFTPMKTWKKVTL